MPPWFERQLRHLLRARLARSDAQTLLRMGERRVLKALRRAARVSPAYRTLLAEAGVKAESVRSLNDFSTRCPVLDKSNTFRRFKLRELLAEDIQPQQLASILTSSGHGAGGYAIGLSTFAQQQHAPAVIDFGLDLAFEVDHHKTLLINCLPMGVTFRSDAVCVANVSVREDMACALVQQAGDLFEQIVLCGDPLFLKRLCDYSQSIKLDWRRYRVHVVIGEETFAESFRDYLAGVLGNNPDDGAGGLICSSMGVGELGLNLFNETRETVALRRACQRNPDLQKALLGGDTAQAPTFLVFNPLRTHVEFAQPDIHGAGDLLITMLDMTSTVPLLRYRTGDRMQLLSPQALCLAERQTQGSFVAPPLPVVALFGRSRDALAGGLHVDDFKQALYLNPILARNCSGAFRLLPEEGGLRWVVQLARDAQLTPTALAGRLSEHLPPGALVQICCHAYADFPYAMTLDYERKFAYWPA